MAIWSGARGDDTYLFTFGLGGEHDIDEAGLDTARKWADIIGNDEVKAAASADGGVGTPDGRDVLEIRGFGGVVDIDPENLAFARTATGDLIVGLQTGGGTEIAAGGYVRIKNMDRAATQVEVLRVVSGDEVLEYDLVQAWNDGVFDDVSWADETARGFRQLANGNWPSAWEDDGGADLAPYLLSSSGTAQDAFDGHIGDWLDQIDTSFRLIPGADLALDAAGNVIGDLIETATGVPGEAPEIA